MPTAPQPPAPFLPEEEGPLDPKALVRLDDIDFSVECRDRVVIVRKHYPAPYHHRPNPAAVRLYRTPDEAVRVFSFLERNGHRACLNFYYRTRQQWEDREQVSAWRDRPRTIEVPGRLRAS